MSLHSIQKRRPLTQAEFMRLMQLLNTQRIIANGLAQLDFLRVWPGLRGRRPDSHTLCGLASPKLLELRELVTQLVREQERKVVVFSQWRRMLRLAHWAVGDILVEGDLEARFFTGAEGARRRTQNLVDFHDDERVRILFATDAGGVGLNLQRAANACINLELPWNPAVLEQRIGRIHRLGQSNPIDVYVLIGAGSLEERIAGSVADKQELFRGIFDGESEAVRFESGGRFLDRIGFALDGESGNREGRASAG
jgi:SNF2 family DNA or RNA helicase